MVAEAVRLVRSEDSGLEIDGEMQADTAVDAARLRSYGFSHLHEPANVLVFSRLSAANAAYKLLDHLGGADAIGPVLLGMKRPIHILQRGCSVQDVLNLTTVASVDWQARTKQI
jgi:malate dehydrogenase (oxaloacetate-decarboxylating)(NADP+)